MLIAQDSGRVVSEELHELGIHAPLVGGVGWARHAQGVVERKTIKIDHCGDGSAILVSSALVWPGKHARSAAVCQ